MKKQQLYIKNDKGRYEPYKEPLREDVNVYVKDNNGKYRAIGLYGRDWIGEGLWLVTDASKIAAAEDINAAVDEYLFKLFGCTIEGIAHQDLAEELTKVIMNLSKEQP